MRKLTLEERIQRLEKLLVKNEETRDTLKTIPSMIRDAFANDELLKDYFDKDSGIRVTSLSRPARARRDDKWNEVDFNIYSTQPTNVDERDFRDMAIPAIKKCLKDNGFTLDYAVVTPGNEYTMFSVVLKSDVKPVYYKPGKDTDAEWETDSDHKLRKYY